MKLSLGSKDEMQPRTNPQGRGNQHLAQGLGVFDQEQERND